MKLPPGRIFLLYCAAFALSCGGAATRPVQTPFEGAPVLALSDSLLAAGVADTVDLGRVREGEVVTRQLQLLNAGRTPLVVLSVETSCGCTETDFPRQPLVPGEKAPFSFTFDSRGFSGWQFKSIVIRTSVSAQPCKLFVTAEVE